ncbi:MAG: hypothetical protein P8N56_05115 [Schleiferiaceae bacterium]|nr:hypothetical protein [Schleiferiaceae bacterium]
MSDHTPEFLAAKASPTLNPQALKFILDYSMSLYCHRSKSMGQSVLLPKN